MKELKGQITISRPTCGDGEEYISIQIKDHASRVRFLDVKIGYAEFAQLLTGVSETYCTLITRGLENVGKKKLTEKLSFKMWTTTYEQRHEVAYQLAMDNAPKGWIPSSYFGSKTSFTTDKDGAEWAHTTMSKWVAED